MTLGLLDGTGRVALAVRPQGVQPLPPHLEHRQDGIVFVGIAVAAHAGPGHLLHVRHARYGDASILPLAGTLGLETELTGQGVQKLSLGIGKVCRHGQASAGVILSELDEGLREADAIVFRYGVDICTLHAVDELGLGPAAAAARCRGVLAAWRPSSSAGAAGTTAPAPSSSSAGAAGTTAPAAPAATATATAATAASTTHIAQALFEYKGAS